MMTAAGRGTWRRTAVAVLGVLVLVAVAGADVMATQPMEPAQDEFVPIDELPPEDRLPAAPLLVAAYGIVWVVLFGYLWSIWRRLGSVERDLSAMAKRTGGDLGAK